MKKLGSRIALGLTRWTSLRNCGPGGRVDALKHALGANAIHGQRRTNADKRRCVEIAVKEFGGLSSRAIAELCAVGHQLVDQVRGPLDESSNATRTTSDGRQYPATRATRKPVELAVKEFASLSSRAIAELCGVSADMVIANRPQVSDSDNSKRTGTDGRQYPAARKPRITTPEEEETFYFGGEGPGPLDCGGADVVFGGEL